MSPVCCTRGTQSLNPEGSHNLCSFIILVTQAYIEPPNPSAGTHIYVNTAPVNKASSPPRETYFASVADNVKTPLGATCPTDGQTPQGGYRPRYLTPVVRLVGAVGITIRSRIHSQTAGQVKVCINLLHNFLLVVVRGAAQVACHSVHSVRDVPPRHARLPDQSAHSLPVWPVSSRFALFSSISFHTGGRGDARR